MCFILIVYIIHGDYFNAPTYIFLGKVHMRYVSKTIYLLSLYRLRQNELCFVLLSNCFSTFSIMLCDVKECKSRHRQVMHIAPYHTVRCYRVRPKTLMFLINYSKLIISCPGRRFSASFSSQ